MKKWLTAKEYKSSRSSLVDKLTIAGFAAVLAGTYGYLAATYKWPPYRQLAKVQAGRERIEEMLGWRMEWYYQEVGNVPLVKAYQPANIAPGLTLVTGLGPDDHTEARVIDSQGKIVQHWDKVDWFKLWPNPTHVPANRFEGPPGPNIHGTVLMQNGDLIIDLESAALMRLDACGEVKWKLPRASHHAVSEDDDGNLWVLTQENIQKKDPRLPGYAPPIFDTHVVKLTPDGKIVQEWSILDLLLKNGMRHWLYLPTDATREFNMVGDPLHVNDVEIFPSSMKAGVFKPGDMMISIRNISTIIVVDPATGMIKQIFTGSFIRQHDPDFVDGNTIRVFDNNTPSGSSDAPSSRLVELYADGRQPRIIFEGNKAHSFFSNVMGKQETLPNGNILLAESAMGRALEIDPQGKPVWEYRNFYRPGVSALLTDAQRLDPKYDAAFFKRARAACGA